MNFLFWTPFGIGSIYQLRKEIKKPLPWGLPVSALATTSFLHMWRGYKNTEEFTVKHVKDMPKMFTAAAICQGSFFCLGHLFMKMAYPVFED